MAENGPNVSSEDSESEQLQIKTHWAQAEVSAAPYAFRRNKGRICSSAFWAILHLCGPSHLCLYNYLASCVGFHHCGGKNA